MASFLDERFPDCISFGSSGGPQYRTTAIELLSGHEQRNKEWSYPRHTYNVSYGARTYENMQELVRFFNAAAGRLYGFRYKDPLDYSSAPDRDTPITPTDQTIKVADGTETGFQVIKNYTVGPVSQRRIITRLVASTLVVAVDGTPATPTSVDIEKGTFNVTAGAGAVVTAGYEFDVPCRFETDALDVAFESYNNLASNIRVLEIREGPHFPL